MPPSPARHPRACRASATVSGPPASPTPCWHPPAAAPGRTSSQDELDRLAQLAQRADLEHAAAVGGVGGQDRVGGVPLGPGLGVEPVDGPAAVGDLGQDLGPGGAVVVAGVAGDDDRRAVAEPPAAALAKLAEDRA